MKPSDPEDKVDVTSKSSESGGTEEDAIDRILLKLTANSGVMPNKLSGAKAAIQSLLAEARIDELQSFKRIHEAGNMLSDGTDWAVWIDHRLAELAALAGKSDE